MTLAICERLRAIRGYRPCECKVDAPINPDGDDAAEIIDALYEALKKARQIIQEERDNMVECATSPPEHDLATLDPMTKPCVDEYDAALAKIDAALTKAEER